MPPLSQSKESEYPNAEIRSSVSESNDNYETGHDEFTNGAKSKLPSKSLAKSKLFKRGKELPDDDGDDESEGISEDGEYEWFTNLSVKNQASKFLKSADTPVNPKLIKKRQRTSPMDPANKKRDKKK